MTTQIWELIPLIGVDSIITSDVTERPSEGASADGKEKMIRKMHIFHLLESMLRHIELS